MARQNLNMNYKEEIIKDFTNLAINYKFKDIDLLIKKYKGKDVSFLKELVNKETKYYRFYFGVSLLNLKDIEEQFQFIEDNFFLLSSWWHVDELLVFIKDVPISLAFKKSKIYLKNKNEYVRRWGYVLFLKNLYKDKKILNNIFNLFKDDSSYHVMMAEARLLSYLAIYFKDETYSYLKESNLSYSLISKTISKINDSYRVSKEDKELFKKLRNKLKEERYERK